VLIVKAPNKHLHQQQYVGIYYGRVLKKCDKYYITHVPGTSIFYYIFRRFIDHSQDL